MQISNRTGNSFQSNSLQNYQSRKCDFCLYHNVIFEQLERLKEAVILKNQRIKELQSFIAKISSMAFLKNPLSNDQVSISKPSKQNLNQSSQQFQNQDSLNFQNNPNGAFFKKKFQQSSQISFQQSKINNGKFEQKLSQTSPDLSRRFKKINELNDLKRQLQKKIIETNNKQNNKLSQKIDSMTNSRQFDTMRTLSEPYQQGQIGSMIHSSCENSRLNELTQTKMRFQDSNALLKKDNQDLGSQSMKASGSLEDKNLVNIIKEQIKRLK